MTNERRRKERISKSLDLFFHHSLLSPSSSLSLPSCPIETKRNVVPSSYSPPSSSSSPINNIVNKLNNNSQNNITTLTIHNNKHSSGKTCENLHILNGSWFMSKYGANGADDALGIWLHGLIVSATVRGYHKQCHHYRHRSGDGVDKRSERRDNNNVEERL